MIVLPPAQTSSPAVQQASDSAQARAHRPNLELYVYRRCWTPGEKISLNFQGYNLNSAAFTIYRFDLAALVQSSRDLDQFDKKLQALRPGSLRIVRSWSRSFVKTYRDQWFDREISVPSLPPGVYLVRVTGGGVEKRAWFAVTSLALFSKQSRQRLIVFATNALTGQPSSNLSLTAHDSKGIERKLVSSGTGIFGSDLKGLTGNLWLYGESQGNPAFVISGQPGPPPSHTVYMYTDRPIYRPGQQVQFRGTVRERMEANEPGGYVYKPFRNRKLSVEIREVTGSIVFRREVQTNEHGTFRGIFQLADEPSLGQYEISAVFDEADRYYATFEVQAYRKPEFTVSVAIPKTHFLGGETVPVTIQARYFFGQPVVDAQVRYHIEFQVEEDHSGGEIKVEPPLDGEGITDAQGQLVLNIKTQRITVSRTLAINATVTDLSRRSQSANGRTLITPGLFRLSLFTDRYVYRPKDAVIAQVIARDYDDKPVSTEVTVRMIETKYDRLRRPYRETVTKKATTDAEGKASVQFVPPRPGYLSLEAEAFDSEDNRILTQGYVWVASDEEQVYDYPTLELITAKPSYQPGEDAVLLLNTSLVKGRTVWALITVEGERLYSYRVMQLKAKSTTFSVKMERIHFPSVRVKAAFILGKHVYESGVQIRVPLPDKRLQVTVESDRVKYEPGQTASYTIRTSDHAGKPVSAEIGVGIVDSAIYAIRQDNTADLHDSFWGGQEVRVSTDFSFAQVYSGGAAQTLPPAPLNGKQAKTEEGIRIRRRFEDTAYWNPSVITDESGIARVSVELPDNLTTWRTTARGISDDTLVGSTTQNIIVSLPLLVRLELPRFYVDGDEGVVSTIVHNYTIEPRSVRVRIESDGADLLDEAVRSTQIPEGGQTRVDWHVRVRGKTSARFLVVADGGPGARDATELILPVLANGVSLVTSHAGTVDERSMGRLSRHTASIALQVPAAALPGSAKLRIHLSPSVAAAVFDGLEFLTRFPYGCAEQTMDAFLPDVIVARTLKKLGVERKVHPDLEQWVNLGLQKLYRYQHQDGGWNWWEFDQTDGDMTAYILWGLIQAKEAGYLVDTRRIDRGAEALLRLLAQQKDPSRRADWLVPLAYVRGEAIADPLDQLFDQREKLDTYGQASLCMALAVYAKRGGKDRRLFNLGTAEDSRKAFVVANKLEKRAVERGTMVYWSRLEGGYSWRNDDVEVTAHVLRALLSARPESPQIAPAVRWLMANRTGQAWGSTKNSAEAILALSMYLERAQELQPEYTARVFVNGKNIREEQVNASSVFQPPITIETTELTPGENTIYLEKVGTGNLYYTAILSQLMPESNTIPVNNGIRVRRTYALTAHNPIEAGTLTSGTLIEVEVSVTAEGDYRYAVLEDPLPAGFEVEPPNGEGGMTSFFGVGGQELYGRMEVRDTKVVFFFNDLPRGTHRFRYHMLAEQPGKYQILPSACWLMYFPEVRGNSGFAAARVAERK